MYSRKRARTCKVHPMNYSIIPLEDSEVYNATETRFIHLSRSSQEARSRRKHAPARLFTRPRYARATTKRQRLRRRRRGSDVRRTRARNGIKSDGTFAASRTTTSSLNIPFARSNVVVVVVIVIIFVIIKIRICAPESAERFLRGVVVVVAARTPPKRRTKRIVARARGRGRRAFNNENAPLAT